MQQPPFSLQHLPGRAAIAAGGPDAAGFLQGLVTADIAALAEGQACYAALLQPQAKILFEFFVLKTADGFLIDCDAGLREDVLKRLGMYRLRSKLALVASDLEVGVSPDEPQAPLRYRDPRNPMLGWRLFAEPGSLPAGDAEAYRAASIRLGIAGTDAIGSGRLFPHEANLDQLGAVSFTKGCYVGQEVVSRMEHRGTARARILPVRVATGEVHKGSEIMSGGKPIGTILGAAGGDGLALIRLDRLAEARGAGLPLLTDGAQVSVIKPDWARFDVAG